MKNHLVLLRKGFAGKTVNFEFGPDDPDYGRLKEFQNDQLRQLHDMFIPGRPETRDTPSDTYRHSYRVANDVFLFATYIGLSDQVARNLRWGVLLHDIGKLDVPSEILNKPGRLTEAEFEEMKNHTRYGADRIMNCGIDHPIVKLAAEIAMYHHERPDGQGYYGVTGKKLPSRLRLVQLCDIYDAVSAPRNYRTAREQLSIYDTMKNILDPHGFLHGAIDMMFAKPYCLLKLNLAEADLSHEHHKMLEQYLLRSENFAEGDYLTPIDLINSID